MSSSENPPPTAPTTPASEQSQTKQPDAQGHVVHSSPQKKQEAPSSDAQSKQAKKGGSSGWGIVIGIVLLGFALGIGYYLYSERHKETTEVKESAKGVD